MDSNHRPHAYQACALTRLSYRPLCAPPEQAGGPDRVRTDDLLDANQALSQLSYGPVLESRPRHSPIKDPRDYARGVFENRIDLWTLAGPSNGSVDLSPLLRVTLLRKEVIQPQVLLQLPCYDFTPITKFTIET